ncbi:MAG: acyl dehydratase, partial [Pseudomonadota bacterium]
MQDAAPTEHRQSDALDPARAQSLFATLGLPDSVSTGDVLPPFFHQIYFWDARPPMALGRDGHP